MKRILLLTIICTLLLCFSAAAAEDAAELHTGMSIAEVEALWGLPTDTPWYSSIRCYQKDGRTLICGYGPCDAEYRTFGLVAWVEFGALGRTGGNIPPEDTVWQAWRSIHTFDLQAMSFEEEQQARIIDVGSGWSIPAKITADGWVVVEDLPFLPEMIPLVWQAWPALLLPPVLLVLSVVMMIMAVWSLIRRIKEPSAEESTLQHRWQKTVNWLLTAAAGLSFCFAAWTDSRLLYKVLVLISLFAACAMANWRIRWTEEGFEYQTALRREIRYGFGDVRRIRRMGTGKAELLVIHAGHRLILLDGTQNNAPFLAALDRWRAGQGLPPIEAADRDRWKEAYLRHGPFRRKLDRIRGGLAYLVLILAISIPCAAIAVTALAVAVAIGSHTTGSLVAAVIVILMLSLFIFLPVRYIRAVSCLDKKTLDWYFRPAVIRADPLEDTHKQDHDRE